MSEDYPRQMFRVTLDFIANTPEDEADIYEFAISGSLEPTYHPGSVTIQGYFYPEHMDSPYTDGE